MSRSQKEWLALEDLMVWIFLKRGVLLSVLSIALGLLTLSLLGDVGWAMFVFLGTLISGLFVGIWRDRGIKRAFREDPNKSPRQVIEHFKLGRRRRRA